MKICIFGAKGYLGQEFLKLYPDARTPACDIADTAQVAAVLDELTPDIVINAAGKTGRPNVDWCEDHKEETIRSNVTGPLVLLHECLKRSVLLVHIGSGCIYEGDNGGAGFTEDDPPNFFGSFYSRSKGAIDQILREFPVLSLRLRMPFDGTDSERSLITKLRRYPKIIDVQNSVTYTPDFMEAARVLIERRATGVYNIVNPGTISAWEIMQLYREQVEPSHVCQRISLSELGAMVKATRSNCVLSTAKIEREGIRMKPVRVAVEESLRQIAERMAVLRAKEQALRGKKPASVTR